jgi:hypothetical protein
MNQDRNHLEAALDSFGAPQFVPVGKVSYPAQPGSQEEKNQNYQ